MTAETLGLSVGLPLFPEWIPFKGAWDFPAFFFSLFFSNLEHSSLASCTVVHERREIVLSKFDVSNVSIKYVTRYEIVFWSSTCLHSALSHSYLEDVLSTRRKSLKGFTAKTLNSVLRIQPCILQIKLPVVLLVGVKICNGAESVWSKGISQSLIFWNWQEIAPNSGGIVLPNCPLKGFYPCFGST